jgi:hypothetical protein
VKLLRNLLESAAKSLPNDSAITMTTLRICCEVALFFCTIAAKCHLTCRVYAAKSLLNCLATATISAVADVSSLVVML